MIHYPCEKPPTNLLGNNKNKLNYFPEDGITVQKKSMEVIHKLENEICVIRSIPRINSTTELQYALLKTDTNIF